MASTRSVTPTHTDRPHTGSEGILVSVGGGGGCSGGLGSRSDVRRHAYADWYCRRTLFVTWRWTRPRESVGGSG